MDSRRTNSVKISGTRSLVNPVDRTGNDRASAQSLSSSQVLVLPGQLVGNFDFGTKKKRPAPKPPNHQPPLSEAGCVRSEAKDAVVRNASDDTVTDVRIVPQAKPRVTLKKVSAEEPTIEAYIKPDRVPCETKSSNGIDEVSTRSECLAIDESSSMPKAAPRSLTQPTTQKLTASESGEQDCHAEQENSELQPDLRQKLSSSTTRREPGPKQSLVSLKSSSGQATVSPFHPEDDVVSSPDEKVSQQRVNDNVADVANIMKPKRKAPLRQPPKATTRSSGKHYEHSWTKI